MKPTAVFKDEALFRPPLGVRPGLIAGSLGTGALAGLLACLLDDVWGLFRRRFASVAMLASLIRPQFVDRTI